MIFHNRIEAGKKLAQELKIYREKSNGIVIGLPRGGVVVAHEVARILGLPLDVIVPRKIGAPGNKEFAIGAIAEDGQGVFDEKSISELKISKKYITQEIQIEQQEAARRLLLYRRDKPLLQLQDKIVILVDDGVATGATMRAAIQSARAKKASRIIVATPVIAQDTFEKIQKEADKVIALHAPLFFGAVGMFYRQFDQTEDAEVIALLGKEGS